MRVFSLDGNIGITSSIFSKKDPPAPKMPSWEDPSTYPATKGLAQIRDVTFSNYKDGCNRNYVWMTNKKFGDLIHPTEFSGVVLNDVEEASKVGENHFLF